MPDTMQSKELADAMLKQSEKKADSLREKGFVQVGVIMLGPDNERAFIDGGCVNWQYPPNEPKIDAANI